jgi:hypothetical protein
MIGDSMTLTVRTDLPDVPTMSPAGTYTTDWGKRRPLLAEEYDRQAPIWEGITPAQRATALHHPS